MSRICVSVFLFIFSLAALAQDDSADSYSSWLALLKAEAQEKGFSESAIALLDEVSLLERAVKADRAQPEFKESYQDYIDKRVGASRIKQGRAFIAEHSDLLDEVSAKYGVQKRFIVAILGVESNYGTYKLPHSALDAVVTLAFDPRRGDRFRTEVFAILSILDQNLANKEQLTSSWAGALGAPQFMPSTYLKFAIDYDGDGDKDIWSINGDLFASVANYLSHYGWHDEETWARKVKLPEGKIPELVADTENRVELDHGCKKYHEHLQGWRNLSEWNDVGIRRMNDIILPLREIPASLIVTHEDHHHGFLVYRNFCSIMRYNPSFKYALSVGILSDELKSN